MAKQTFQMHLYARESWESFSDEAPQLKYLLQAWADMESSGIYIGPVMVEAEVPVSFDMRAAKLKAKQAELTKVRAEFIARITDLTRQINELQALEMSAPAGEVA
jgi:hypothetical protein